MVICIAFDFFKNHSEDVRFINFYSLLVKCFLGQNTHEFLCYLALIVLGLSLHSGFILKAIFIFGFTVWLSSKWVEYLCISLTICTQAPGILHTVKHSAEKKHLRIFFFSLYHWGTEINSFTVFKGLKHLFCLAVKQLCCQDFYEC